MTFNDCSPCTKNIYQGRGVLSGLPSFFWDAYNNFADLRKKTLIRKNWKCHFDKEHCLKSATFGSLFSFQSYCQETNFSRKMLYLLWHQEESILPGPIGQLCHISSLHICNNFDILLWLSPSFCWCQQKIFNENHFDFYWEQQIGQNFSCQLSQNIWQEFTKSSKIGLAMKRPIADFSP